MRGHTRLGLQWTLVLRQVATSEAASHRNGVELGMLSEEAAVIGPYMVRNGRLSGIQAPTRQDAGKSFPGVLFLKMRSSDKD